MQIDSSARPTCLRLRSTVECTATVLMPRLWQARSTRNAISPRLAMTTFSSIRAASGNHEHGFVEFHRLAVLDQDGLHGAGHVGLDLVEHLHRLDDAQRLAGLDLLADLDAGRRARRGRGLERAAHRSPHHVPGTEPVWSRRLPHPRAPGAHRRASGREPVVTNEVNVAGPRSST